MHTDKQRGRHTDWHTDWQTATEPAQSHAALFFSSALSAQLAEQQWQRSHPDSYPEGTRQRMGLHLLPRARSRTPAPGRKPQPANVDPAQADFRKMVATWYLLNKLSSVKAQSLASSAAADGAGVVCDLGRACSPGSLAKKHRQGYDAIDAEGQHHASVVLSTDPTV